MLLQKENAIQELASLCGHTDPFTAKRIDPFTLRAQFGVDAIKNAVFASPSENVAASHISLLLGD